MLKPLKEACVWGIDKSEPDFDGIRYECQHGMHFEVHLTQNPLEHLRLFNLKSAECRRKRKLG